MPKRHVFSYRVCYADTDRMDRVYYANYLVICERARTEFLRDIGHSYQGIEASGCFFPVRQCHVRYHNFAVYDDMLECRSYIGAMRHATLTFVTEIHRSGEYKPLVVASVELACVAGESGKPCVIPERLRTALAEYIAE